MKIKIKLLSDLCTASGETYNSLVDTDVVYDELGLPYIPAKRIKGCIREAALEMTEMGLMEEHEFAGIFGQAGHQKAGFYISNAYLADYKETSCALKTLQHHKGSGLASQQNVLNQYTYMRTQTAVDLETGVADENSLRTIRVVRKGLEFEAECSVADAAHIEKISQAVSLVKHMGVSRTRGLGLVNMVLDKSAAAGSRHIQISRDQLSEHNRLRYQIYLRSAVICKSAQGNQAITEDYISGSKILGVLAGTMGSQKYREMMALDELVVTNAYINVDGERCIPGRSSLQKEKDQPWDSAGQMQLIDMLYDERAGFIKGKQMTPANVAYMSPDGTKTEVETQISYHHQRPDDKSIGRATGQDDGSSFYQLCSISAGQRFTGLIYADKMQAQLILDALENADDIRLGYGRGSEFGAVDFVIDEVKDSGVNSEGQVVQEHDVVVTLISDVIMYNADGSLTTDTDTLIEYLRQAAGVGDIKMKDGTNPYLKFVNIGGFNVTWGARKPVFDALGKGTTFMIHSDSGINIQLLNRTFIGERVSEGYGEIFAEKMGSCQVTISKPKQEPDSEKVAFNDSADIIQKLLFAEFRRLMEGTVRKKAGDFKKNQAGLNAAVSKLRIMYQENNSYEELKSQVQGIESADKNKLCTNIVANVNPAEIKNNLLKQIQETYDMKLDLENSYGADCDEKLYRDVYHAYIGELKNIVKIIDSKPQISGREKKDA